MTAQPVEQHPRHDPDDILRRLPADQRDRFLHEYQAALNAAHETWRYRQLQQVLQLWHMRAVSWAQPDYESRAAQARAGKGDFVPAEDVIPGWAGLTGHAKRTTASASPPSPRRRSPGCPPRRSRP